MSAVDLGTARHWLRTIANETPDKMAKCNYATNNAEGGFDPDCILGVMMARYFHIDPTYLASLGSVFSAVYTEALPYVAIESDALFYMCLVQSFQDGAACNQQNWQDAVTKADTVMCLIDRTNGTYETDNVNAVARYAANLGE